MFKKHPAQQRGRSCRQSPTGHRSPRAGARPGGVSAPGDPAPRSRRPPANAAGVGTAGLSPRASGRACQAGGDPLPQFPPPGRPSGPRHPSRSRPRPQPAALPPPPRPSSPDSHPHRALVRGAPHAGGGRRPGSGASAPRGGGAARGAGARGAGAGAAGRPTHLRRAPAMLATEWKGGGGAGAGAEGR